MCLIIHKPASRQIPAAFLEHVCGNNADGWGVAVLHAGHLISRKGLGLADLLACSSRLPAHAEVYFHLRRATYGPVSVDMAHPFEVRPGLLLMHNGCLAELAPEHGGHSDTAELARLLRDMLLHLSEPQVRRLIRSQGFARLTQPLLGKSMVLLVDAHGAVRLGRQWHVIEPHEWPDAAMHGIAVSNTRTWRDALAPGESLRSGLEDPLAA